MSRFARWIAWAGLPALGVVIGLSAGRVDATPAAAAPALAPPPGYIKFAPDPDALVNLAQDATSPPYVVPAGKKLVLTDYSQVGNYGYLVYVNGSLIWSCPSFMFASASTGVLVQSERWNPGLIANAGDQVEVRTSYSGAMAYASGYLEDAGFNPGDVRVPYVPPAATIVRIDSSAGNYIVPPNRHLVIRDWAAGSPTWPAYLYGAGATIQINGITVWDAWDNTRGHGSLESGIIANPLDAVTVVPSYGYPQAHLLGFLRP